MAATAEEVMSSITRVKTWMQSKSWFTLFRTPPPIGHADTTRNAALSNADFIGANIFPFWNPDPIDKAWESFEGNLQGVKQRAGNTPVWITETGWPSNGNDSTATMENMQRYWRDVGCEVLGKYTTFWFELERETQDVGGLDWGVVDIESQEMKIKELGCPENPAKSSTSEDVAARRAMPAPTLSGSPFHTKSISIPTLSNSPSLPATPTISADETTTITTNITTHLNLTSTISLPSTITLRNTTLAPNRTLHLVHKTITSFITISPNTTLSSTAILPPNSTLHTIPSNSTHTTLHKTHTSPTTLISSPPSSRPTVWITIPTGCITLSLDEQGRTVTVSNPPVSGRCSVPGYTPAAVNEGKEVGVGVNVASGGGT